MPNDQPVLPDGVAHIAITDAGDPRIALFRDIRERDLTGSRLALGIGISCLPDKYAPVSDPSKRPTAAGVPSATTRPPKWPAPGPISIK